MIETFKTIRVWEKEDLLKIPKSLNKSIAEIMNEFKDEKEEEDFKLYYSRLVVGFRTHSKIPERKCFIQFNIDFTDLFIKYYNKHDLRPAPNRITVISPDVIVQERERREIISKDFQIEYPQYKIADVMNYLQGKSKPRLDFLKDLTDYIQIEDRDVLNLPPNKGIRWDLDKWINTSKIPKKQSWEQQYD